MNYWGITDKGLVRKRNEDAYFACCNEENDYALLVVCDGMGGVQSGDVASKTACETLVDYINQQELQGADFPAASQIFFDSVVKANEAVYQKSIEDVNCAGMGTTLVAALIHEGKALIANVGDSRAYIIEDGDIIQVTRDHSLVEDMVTRGEISREEARTHPQRNLITRALGTLPDVEPDIFSIDLSDDAFLLLCSDGLTNVIEDREILATLSKLEHHDHACEILLRAAFERGAPDNVTVILYKN